MHKIAFLFAGQGQQYVGMGQDIAQDYPFVKDLYSQAESILDKPILNLDEAQMHVTENTQPALITLNEAIVQVLKQAKIVPDYVAGLSLGEYSALLTADVFDFESAIKMVNTRAYIMANALPKGSSGMAAVLKADFDLILSVLNLPQFKNQVEVCNVNTHEQVVIGGNLELLGEAIDALKAAGVKRVIPLKVSTVSHMSLLKPAGEELRSVLSSYTFKQPKMTFLNNVEAQVQETDFVSTLSRQLYEPTHFYETIHFLLQSGVDVFVEIGPKGALSGFVRSIAKKEDKTVHIFNAYDSSSIDETQKGIGAL